MPPAFPARPSDLEQCSFQFLGPVSDGRPRILPRQLGSFATPLCKLDSQQERRSHGIAILALAANLSIDPRRSDQASPLMLWDGAALTHSSTSGSMEDEDEHEDERRFRAFSLDQFSLGI